MGPPFRGVVAREARGGAALLDLLQTMRKKCRTPCDSTNGEFVLTLAAAATLITSPTGKRAVRGVISALGRLLSLRRRSRAERARLADELRGVFVQAAPARIVGPWVVLPCVRSWEAYAGPYREREPEVYLPFWRKGETPTPGDVASEQRRVQTQIAGAAQRGAVVFLVPAAYGERIVQALRAGRAYMVQAGSRGRWQPVPPGFVTDIYLPGPYEEDVSAIFAYAFPSLT